MFIEMKCVHRLKDINTKDKNHLLPKSWCPGPTDSKVQYTTIPLFYIHK